jgi:ECF sigma factor
MPVDPFVFFGRRIVAELVRGLTMMLGRARGDLTALIYVMTLRYFGGMTVAAVAVALGVSVTTVEQDWRLARARLAGRLGGKDR